MRIDMHVHTRYSRRCGWMDPHLLIQEAIEKELDGFAITDHNTIEGAIEATDIVKEEQLKLEVIIGEEITTDRGEILAYFIDEVIEPGSFEDVIAAIRRSGGLSAIPHPFDKVRKGFSGTEEILGEVDAIEVINSRCLFNKRALDLSSERNKPTIGGSDAHFRREVGRAWTEFPAEPRRSILEGKTRAVGGLSSPAYLVLTKGVKLWRKAISGSF